MTAKTLIYQQTHIKTAEQGRLFAVSQALLRRLNPGADYMLVDNASPLDPRQFATGHNFFFQFPESIGHFSPSYLTERDDPRDGPGRAHTYAWGIAHGLGYQRTFYCEADCLFAKPAEWGFQQMTKRIGCQPGVTQYGYSRDWHVVWVSDIPWFVQDFDFPTKYAWETRTQHSPAGEHLYEQILGEEAEILPVTGIRGETVGLSGANFRQHFPTGCDLVTHIDNAGHAEFLRSAGHEDLIEKL